MRIAFFINANESVCDYLVETGEQMIKSLIGVYG